jgi:ABC-type enterochelin transport system substrate-binding protein
MKAAALAKMIAFAQLHSTRQKAKNLGQAMAREDGVQKAVREIEALVEQGRKKLATSATRATAVL